MTFGVIVGNRGFFPDHLAQSGRSEMLTALEKAGYAAVALSPEDSKFGAPNMYATIFPLASIPA